jgi:hypothetical protein
LFSKSSDSIKLIFILVLNLAQEWTKLSKIDLYVSSNFVYFQIIQIVISFLGFLIFSTILFQLAKLVFLSNQKYSKIIFHTFCCFNFSGTS